ncbi:ChrR family anti-sigma-E factor [Ferrimonas marina]|uniref:Anti-ECFsigma factor, ChrR n=1 Tax=Ferrimonas marina TaxID=299255 RepID=A0A1M5VRF0_9GAMM|nr:ChrR family anti-sigma-E factor [Ferrimonas marina]SHH77807.1 anti-ECFsigma factor, ChrR [Ferrimonas marina]
MSNVNHHPDISSLKAYAAGEMAGGPAMLLAAHLEYCEHCRNQMRQLEQSLSQTMEEPCEEPDLLEQMLSQSLAQLPVVDSLPEPEPLPHNEIQLEDKRFVLPQVIARQVAKLGGWNRMPGQLHQARLNIDGSHLHFIHIGKASQVPPHTHKGREFTLVLHGGFSDDAGDYGVGDFICLDESHSHQPRTDEHEDCLVITALEGPLQFTSGLSRMLNPLSQLFFR